MIIVKIILIILASYILGAIPFGVIIGKAVKGIDIRQAGSGNIGAANAIRTLGVVPGILVLVTDVLKGAVPVLLCGYFVPQDYANLVKVLAGISAVMGHSYSMFLKFGGGKSVATSFGVFLALNWYISLLALAVYIIVVFTTKYSSAGSLTATLSMPVFMFVFRQPVEYKAFAILAAVFVFYKHKENIKRLIKGEELKIIGKGK